VSLKVKASSAVWRNTVDFLSPPRPGLILRLAQDKRHRAQLTKAYRPDEPSPNGALLAEPGA
jgi:hypothetical protein